MRLPSPELLNALNVELLAPLGGRFNQHWWGVQTIESIRYEVRLTELLSRNGWPVAALEIPIEFEGELWSLSPFLAGEPPSTSHAHGPRARGRLLAEFHATTSSIQDLEQRPGWRRCETILEDDEIDRILSSNERTRFEEVRIVRWHLDRARVRAEGLRLGDRRSIPVHGDFAPWNLLYQEGRLTGLLDFELSRLDHRVADFALSWRGKIRFGD